MVKKCLYINKDNSFGIIVKKLNDGNPFIIKNITNDDHRISFGEWDKVGMLCSWNIFE